MNEPNIVHLVERAVAELPEPRWEASRAAIDGAAHVVTADLPYDVFIAVREGVEAWLRARRGQVPPSWRLIDPSTVEPRALEWAWQHRIATGTLTIIAGPGGVGKGALWVELVARLSRGQLAGDLRGQPVPALILTAEERIADAIRPRLDAAGADLSRIRVMTMLDGEHDRDATLPDDLDAVREALAETKARLVVIDPLNAHLADRIDSHKDAPLRRALGPLTRLAGDTGAAVLAIAHTNKGTGDAINRVLGSVAYVNAARSVLIVGTPPDIGDSTDRVVALPKANNTAPVPSLRFRLEARQIEGLLPDGTPGSIEVVGVTWKGEDAATADDLLGSSEDRSALGEAIEYLKDALADGAQAKADLVSAFDGSERTLHRARKHLRVIVERDGSASGRPSTWRLPEYVPSEYGPNGLAHTPQASDQEKQVESGDYVPRFGVGTNPPETAVSQVTGEPLPDPLDEATRNVRALFPGAEEAGR